MATSKVERLMNLVICLLSTRQYISAEQIRTSVNGYQDSASIEAFNRMFERDKNELRELGIPVETGRNSPMSSVDGYRISQDAYALPPIDLSADEAAVVAMAGAVWSTPELTTASQSALMKLRAAGVDVDAELDSAILASTPARAVGSEIVLRQLFTAIDARQPVRFTHRTRMSVKSRLLEPWAVVTYDGRWYVVGHDRDRDATRTFRLSRVDAVNLVGRPREFEPPDDVDVHAIVADAASWPDDETSTPRIARIWVAEGSAAGLRRMATGSTPAMLGDDDGSELTVEITAIQTLARVVMSAGPDAVVVEPDDLRQAVLEGMRAVAASHSVQDSPPRTGQIS